MESFSRQTQQPNTVDAESSANFEGIDSILVCERASHPVIKKQIVDLLYKEREAYIASIANETWELHDPEAGEEPRDDDLFMGQKTGKIIVRRQLGDALPSREQIERETDERIDHVSTVTEINFTDGELPNKESIPIEWDMPGQNEKPTAKQKAIVLAHEKGHRIRPYLSTYFDTYFERGFDISKVEYSQSEYEAFNAYNATKLGREPLSFEAMKRERMSYLFSADELVERMSQLKCYFGMRADEIFTPEHLDYARRHYIADTKMDNEMTQFFQSITPETQAAFIELINSSGI